ncbi:MAG: secondary thiamine-phosphate synthase enzyme YjbQ [Elusimicrobiota bacterium]
MNYDVITVNTSARTDLKDITGQVQTIVSKSSTKNGICKIFIPHTTAGVTINENADPNVIRDISMLLDEKIPWTHSSYRHAEGNSAAHIKSTLVGESVEVIIDNGELQFGTWQSIFFCEFDGPRTRKVYVKIIKG